jgi:hypothetical protein
MNTLKELEGQKVEAIIYDLKDEQHIIKVQVEQVNINTYGFYEGWNEKIYITCDCKALQELPKEIDYDELIGLPLGCLVNPTK